MNKSTATVAEKVECLLYGIPQEVRELPNIVMASVEGTRNPVMLSYNDDMSEVVLSVPESSSKMINLGMDLKSLAELVMTLKGLTETAVSSVDRINSNDDFSDAFEKTFDECQLEIIRIKDQGDYVYDENKEDTLKRECDCPGCKSSSQLSDIEADGKEIISAIKEMSKNMSNSEEPKVVAEAFELVSQMRELSEFAEKAVDSCDDENQASSIRDEYKKIMMKSIEDMNSKLTGAPKKVEQLIDFDKLRSDFVKYGPKAAKETLMRIPAEKRDQVTRELMDYLSKK